MDFNDSRRRVKELINSWEWCRQRPTMVFPCHFEFLGCGQMAGFELMYPEFSGDPNWHERWRYVSSKMGFDPMGSIASDPAGKSTEDQRRWANYLSSHQVNDFYSKVVEEFIENTASHGGDANLIKSTLNLISNAPFFKYPLFHQSFVSGLFSYVVSYGYERDENFFYDVYEKLMIDLHGSSAVSLRSADLPGSTRDTSWPKGYREEWPLLSDSVFSLLKKCMS